MELAPAQPSFFSKKRPRLAPEHEQQLRTESGIGQELVDQRGYRTVTTAEDLVAQGYKPRVAKKVTPGLLIPLYSPKPGFTGDERGWRAVNAQMPFVR